MEVVPNDIKFAVGKLESFNRNRFKLQPNGSVTAGPNSRCILTLPSNAILDLRSFCVHLDVSTTSDNTNGTPGVVYAKLPADAASLIAQLTVYIGGVQVCQSFSEYHTACKIKKLIHSSRDRDGSVDGTLSHGLISTSDAVETVSMIFKPPIGLFAESSTRYLSSNLVGDISVEIVFASTNVLAFKEGAVAIDQNFSDADARADALNTTFSISNIFATIDTVTLSESYERMLADRLVAENSLMVRLKEYYSFSLKSTTGTSHDVRFSLSAGSVDALYTVCRDANYEVSGVRTRQYGGASLSDANCANFFKFLAYNDSTTARGSLRYQYDINSVKHPQYLADVLDAAHETIMLTNEHGLGARDTMVSSLTDFCDGKAIFPLILNMPGNPIAVSSGLNTRGANTQFSVSLQGQTLPAANAAAQVTAALSTYVLVETTATMMIQGAKSVAMSY